MPHIIVLNGTSSAGKSTLAKLLQARLDEPYLHVCIDAFEDMMPVRREPDGAFATLAMLPGVLAGMHGSIRALALTGNNLIVDHVIIENDIPADWLEGCIRAVQPFDVHLVGVRCELPELERREAARGDRHAGLAAWQYSRMHHAIRYDLEVDTTATSPEQCVAAIFARLRAGPGQALGETMKQFA